MRRIFAESVDPETARVQPEIEGWCSPDQKESEEADDKFQKVQSDTAMFSELVDLSVDYFTEFDRGLERKQYKDNGNPGGWEA